MKPKNPKLIEEVDVEVVNRQPTLEERQEISAFIRSYKAKPKGAPTVSARSIKA
ncbi:hypothetical protein GO755_03585 [Spirosoma sp. HMF4905]|uniref:Uncharacterized protein n=1 Tax=Spirosoma arboris TaxID=2682092 RepID=A0A7K1S5K4_9BACT|nr:hypothetical protein [Spirosoma arboris]MVM29101.1 hypothetical protein [Spirosoma arboris]